MKRKITFIMALLLVFIGGAKAQNLQLHYDTRNSLYGDNVASANYFTATYEMFKPDKWGSTFMFIDFDFNFDKKNIGLVYTEISRDFKIKNCSFMPHIEYNGGLGLINKTAFGYSIASSYLAGVSYPFQLGKFFMGTTLSYKLNNFKKISNDAQLTITWNGTLLDGKLSLNGFVDLWSENKNRLTGEGNKKLVFMSEPQIWYNITPNFSLGSEVELSYNFVNASFESKFYAIPTIAGKWNF